MTVDHAQPDAHALWRIEAPLANAVSEAVRAQWRCEPPVAAALAIEIPDDPAFGDVACTMAMKLAKTLKRPPVEIARQLAEALQPFCAAAPLSDAIERLEVKPPGFLNVFLKQSALVSVLRDIARAGARFGASTMGHGQRISLEFVSANPTGALSIAHGRQAAVGDALARVLGYAGFEVCREYLLNDEGTQMDLLGHSIYARYRELAGHPTPIPENGYQGTYIIDLARALRERDGDRWMEHPSEAMPVMRDYGIAALLEVIREDLRQFDVSFDRWTSQAALHRDGKIAEVVTALQQAGHVYESEGALWFRSTAFGDEKDRVLRKHDGSWTYFAPDIAYHQDKFERGFHRLIDLWGPDHHGYVPRLTAAVHALTGRGEDMAVLIVQLVTLYRRGVVVPMSTRQGQFISLRELLDEVGKDAARFMFLTRRIESHLDFDLEIAKEQSLKNPVYYVQYAHARVCSIFSKSGTTLGARSPLGPQGSRLNAPEELALLRELRQWPLIIELCARQLDPYQVTWYLRRLAAGFHACYDKRRVVGGDADLMTARLALVGAVQQVLAAGLALLGVSAPTHMAKSDEPVA